MDFMTIIGIISGLTVVFYIMHSGGLAGLLLNFSAALLVFGGTFSCILISYPWRMVKKIPGVLLMIVIPPKTYKPEKIIPFIVSLAEKAKKGGISSLQDNIERIKDRFLRDGIQMVIDKMDPDLLRDNLEKDIVFTRARHDEVANIFRTMGTYAPVFGLLGTLIGVTQVLKNITEPAGLWSSMAVAVTTTFYGIFGANFLFLPAATKLQVLSEQELLIKGVMIEGIVSIQQGDIPLVVEQKLKTYLNYNLRHKEQASMLVEDGI